MNLKKSVLFTVLLFTMNGQRLAAENPLAITQAHENFLIHLPPNLCRQLLIDLSRTGHLFPLATIVPYIEELEAIRLRGRTILMFDFQGRPIKTYTLLPRNEHTMLGWMLAYRNTGGNYPNARFETNGQLDRRAWSLRIFENYSWNPELEIPLTEAFYAGEAFIPILPKNVQIQLAPLTEPAKP